MWTKRPKCCILMMMETTAPVLRRCLMPLHGPRTWKSVPLSPISEKNPSQTILTTAPLGPKAVWTYRSSKTSWSATLSTTSAPTRAIPCLICSGFSHTISDIALIATENILYKHLQNDRTKFHRLITKDLSL